MSELVKTDVDAFGALTPVGGAGTTVGHLLYYGSRLPSERQEALKDAGIKKGEFFYQDFEPCHLPRPVVSLTPLVIQGSIKTDNAGKILDFRSEPAVKGDGYRDYWWGIVFVHRPGSKPSPAQFELKGAQTSEIVKPGGKVRQALSAAHDHDGWVKRSSRHATGAATKRPHNRVVFSLTGGEEKSADGNTYYTLSALPIPSTAEQVTELDAAATPELGEVLIKIHNSKLARLQNPSKDSE